jgi:hypothetical protein
MFRLTCSSALSNILSGGTDDLFEQVLLLIQHGFGPTLVDELNILLTGSFTGQDSETNVNPFKSNTTIY